MNTQSLRFQLILSYAGLLLGTFAIIGVATYLALDQSLTGAVQETQIRRARQVAHLLLRQLADRSAVSLQTRLTDEIEDTFAPSQNGRFIRVTARDGTLLYASQVRPGTAFPQAGLPLSTWPAASEQTRTVAADARMLSASGGGKLMLVLHKVVAPEGREFLIETAAPLETVGADLRKWLFFLCLLLPVMGCVALAGGHVLLNRALSPVDRMVASAERISLHNLSERLPVSETGDELQHLAIALNHMIERLDASFQHSRRFVADASHELRTPLTILRGELESSVFEPNLPPQVRDRLGSALDEVVRLSNIVEGLFAISRLDAGEAAAEWLEFDLARLAASTADQMALLAEDKSIQIECETDKRVFVEGDRARLKQVVVNLLDNAIKYTPEGGHVALKVKADGGSAVLEVNDTGMGIPPEALPRVFERFYRVDRARSREQGGAGLGLSIVKSICTAHRGTVRVTSIPGEGSSFRVELPLAEAPETHHNPTFHNDKYKLQSC